MRKARGWQLCLINTNAISEDQNFTIFLPFFLNNSRLREKKMEKAGVRLKALMERFQTLIDFRGAPGGVAKTELEAAKGSRGIQEYLASARADYEIIQSLWDHVEGKKKLKDQDVKRIVHLSGYRAWELAGYPEKRDDFCNQMGLQDQDSAPLYETEEVSIHDPGQLLQTLADFQEIRLKNLVCREKIIETIKIMAAELLDGKIDSPMLKARSLFFHCLKSQVCFDSKRFEKIVKTITNLRKSLVDLSETGKLSSGYKIKLWGLLKQDIYETRNFTLEVLSSVRDRLANLIKVGKKLEQNEDRNSGKKNG